MSTEKYTGSASEIWDSWTIRQKSHFCQDHKSEIKSSSTALAINQDFDELSKEIKESVEKHIATGKYAKGAVVKTAKQEPKDTQKDFDLIRDGILDRIVENSVEVVDEKPFVEMEKIARKSASKANFEKFSKLVDTIKNKFIKEHLVEMCNAIKSNRFKNLFRFTYGGSAGSAGKVSQVSSLFDLYIQAYNYEKYEEGANVESDWMGTDVNLMTSLEEYGFVATVNENCTEEGEHFVITKCGEQSYNYGYVTESSLDRLINLEEWAKEEDIEGLLSSCGCSKEEWLKKSFVNKFSDIITYFHGADDIMGTSTKHENKAWAYEQIGLDINDYEELEEYKRGANVQGQKHVSVTTGHRLPKGYKAVKGNDKNKNYSKGKPKVKVDAGWRLPHGYETVEAAYIQKYGKGATISSKENETAMSEGWLVSNDENGHDCIQRYDESDIFKTDEEAKKFVESKASKSILHRKALDLCSKTKDTPIRERTLQALLEKDELTKEQRDSMYSMLSKGLRSEKKLRSLKSVINYGLQKYKNAWFAKRFSFDGDRATYAAGQSHPDEMRTIAQELTAV